MNVGDNGVAALDVEDDDELGQQSCQIILFHEVKHTNDEHCFGRWHQRCHLMK